MKAVNIKKIYYIDNNKNFICEKVKNMISIQSSHTTMMIDTKSSDKSNLDKYYEDLLKKNLPSKIKYNSFCHFYELNLKIYLPNYTCKISDNELAIMRSNNDVVIKAIII